MNRIARSAALALLAATLGALPVAAQDFWPQEHTAGTASRALPGGKVFRSAEDLATAPGYAPRVDPATVAWDRRMLLAVTALEGSSVEIESVFVAPDGVLEVRYQEGPRDLTGGRRPFRVVSVPQVEAPVRFVQIPRGVSQGVSLIRFDQTSGPVRVHRVEINRVGSVAVTR